METTTSPQSTDGRQLDSIMALLRSERRRHALATLSDRDSPRTVDELAAAVASREGGTDQAPPSVDEVATTLHHAHLPKLSDVGAVAYDPDAREVSPARAEEFEPYLDATATTPDTEAH